jgi:hypothetical protein
MLLRLRGEDQFTRPIGRHLYLYILSVMVWASDDGKIAILSADQFQHWKSLFASEEPSEDFLFLESQIPKASEEVPAASMRMRGFFHGVTKLRARISNYMSMAESQPVDRIQVVNSYLKAAARLQDKIEGWCDIPEWLPRKVLPNASPRQSQRTDWTTGTLFRKHCYQNFDGFFHWNRYLVAKACLHAGVLDAISTLPVDSTVDKLMVSHINDLQETVRDVLGQMAYAFGDIDEVGRTRPIATGYINNGASMKNRFADGAAMFQIQAPVTYLMTLRYLAPGQREAMVMVLQRLRAEQCIL